MVICVLLKDAATWTTPCGTTRLSRFFLNSFLRLAAAPALPGATASGAAFCCSFATIHSISSGKEERSFLFFVTKPLGLLPISPSCPSPAFWQPLRHAADPYECVRWYECADREPAGCGGDGYRDTPEFRSAGGYSSGSPCGDRLPRGLPVRWPDEA